MKKLIILAGTLLIAFGFAGPSFAVSIIPDDLFIDFRDYDAADGQDSYTSGAVTVTALPDSGWVDYTLSHDSEDGLGVQWRFDGDADEIEGREQLDVDIAGGLYLTGVWITDLFTESEGRRAPNDGELGYLVLNNDFGNVITFDGDDADQQNGELWVSFAGSILVSDALFYGSGSIFNQRDEFSVAGFTGDTAPVPEPATMLLLGTGLVGLAGAGRKKLFKK